jgi:hypothetical protein
VPPDDPDVRGAGRRGLRLDDVRGRIGLGLRVFFGLVRVTLHRLRRLHWRRRFHDDDAVTTTHGQAEHTQSDQQSTHGDPPEKLRA